MQNNQNLSELLFKFLRSQPWTHEQTEFVRKVKKKNQIETKKKKISFLIQMDTLVNPIKQASLGIAKGVSIIGDGLSSVSDTVVGNAGKLFRTNSTNFSLIEETKVEMKKKENFLFHLIFIFRIQKVFHYVFFWLLWMKFLI